jgi:hypothetical protein
MNINVQAKVSCYVPAHSALDPLTKYILTQFYFLDTLTSKAGVHVVFVGLGKSVQDIVDRIC